MDNKTFLGIALCILFYLGYTQYLQKKYPTPESEKNTDENKTVWLILCRETDQVVIKYTIWDEQKDQIFSKEYQLYLPNKEELKKLLEWYDTSE